MTQSIFTIGYGNRTIENFIGILTKRNIDYLIDVRSRPFSRFNPHFRQKSLELHLLNHGISYLFLGNELGGKPKDSTCYQNGKVDYQIVRSKSFFATGIDALADLHQQGLKIALMCAELNPDRCHRKHLVGSHLENLGFDIKHIDQKGQIQNTLF
jgi:uncharacterized protein (DUF488 family)